MLYFTYSSTQLIQQGDTNKIKTHSKIYCDMHDRGHNTTCMPRKLGPRMMENA